jgi:ribosomal protein S18 acetylase RimI-like enzyme
VNYRPYLPDDFAQLYAIEEECFQPPLRFDRRYMRRLIDGAHTATWIAEEEARMAGFAVVEWKVESGEAVAYIQTIEVAPSQRRRGVGDELLRRIESSAQAVEVAEIWLHVDAQNDAAIRLYRAHGYHLAGRQENYYGRSRSAEVYSKSLAAGRGSELRSPPN